MTGVELVDEGRDLRKENVESGVRNRPFLI
jgi:hypothetical protein